MKSNVDLVEVFKECLDTITIGHVAEQDNDDDIRALTSRLAATATEIELLIMDLESGISPAMMGYTSDAEIEELLEAFVFQIQNLQRQINGKLLAKQR